MSDAKHTPVIWVENPRDGIPSVGIDVGDGGELLPIVDLVYGPTKAQAMRNRRLIAAAPELLEALRECSARLSACRLLIEDDDARHMAAESVVLARAAIAKATGSVA